MARHIGPNHVVERTIRGTVSDQSGKELAAVNVIITDKKIGVYTNEKGEYMISGVPVDGSLTFSHIGYITQTIKIGPDDRLDVVMKENNAVLNEVVVVGYGTQAKAKVTGSVATIDSKVLESRPVSNVSQALQGVAGGLNITQSGSLGGSLDNRPTINIRGIATIGQGSTGAPLILVDGMEADINAINPQDIETISVLKDAASSSIYGSRAPFGVILITTKKGKTDRIQVNYNNNFSWSRPVLLPQMADSYQFAMLFNTGYRNSGSGDFLSPSNVQRILDYQAGKIKTTNIPDPNNPTLWATANTYGNANFDMYKAIYGNNAPTQEHAVSVSGGNGRTTYYLSGDYRNENGLLSITRDNYKRFTSTIKISNKLTSWATVDYSGRFIREDFEKPSALTSSSRYAEFTMNQYFTGWMSWPIVPLYDDNGRIYSITKDSQGNAFINGGRMNTQNDWTYHQLKLTLEPLPGWNIYGNLNYRINDYFRHQDNQKLYGYTIAGDPILMDGASSVQEDAYRTNYFSPNVYSEYARSFGGHNLKIMAGFQSEVNKTRNLSTSRQGLIVSTVPTLATTSGTDQNGASTPPIVSGSYADWATAGYFGRFNYDYNARYLLELNLRYDGTSRFQGDKQWRYFPSASIGWNVAREAFWDNLNSYVNNLKFRASYGQLGNQNTSNWYPTYATMPIGTANGTWLVGGVQPNTASAPALISTSLTWERVRTWNVGADVSFLRNRLNASFDYFTRFTNDMVGPAIELPAILGTTVPSTNNTDLKTYGFEFDLKWQDRLKNNLGYNVHLILSDSKTQIINYPNPTGSLATYRSGTTVGDIWGYETVGIAKTQEEMDRHLSSLPNGGQNALGNSWKAGDIMYRDQNGDGKIDQGANTTDNHGDLIVIGNTTPRYSFGVDLGLNWKGFDFRAFFQGVGKRDYFRGGSTFFGPSGQIWWSTAYVQHLDYFRDDPSNPLGLNLDSYYPRPLFNTVKNQQSQTRYLQDASYIRLKNIQLGYTLPQTLTKKAKIQSLRVYVSAENVWTLTRMSKVFDPETIDGGYLGAVYPLFKRLSFGTSITF
ncbi:MULTISPECIES: TonB-dependent receptor [unclassified Spirosoma]|uniref:SusC/RagA family TonB-linked outer membrane protein n=1 Tax=unclassified Spirosoma TaxID=2621999 RepID=UPI000962D76F|nr:MULTISPECIES: TonB-dependent receptor [unclassified Spirosoma]MBN8825688.1 TonB-dependent receptor [Spirosoma sp.]OJW76617.1 MAG: SusC/RagA family protein [Spirosoma sp. 48-14]